MGEERLEAVARLQETEVARVDDAIVPFQTFLQGLAADVARPNEGSALDELVIVRHGKDVRLQVEAAALRHEDAHLGTLLAQKQ